MLKQTISLLVLLTTLVFSCQKKINEEIEQDFTESSKRMAFNQDVYLLDSRTNSTIYKVNYDFQGLQGDAFLEELPISTTIPKGGHMCVSPDQNYLTVVISKGKAQGMIYLVNLSSYEVKTIRLFDYGLQSDEYTEQDVIQAEEMNDPKYQFKGKITQVDVDEAGYLFIAGKSGFFKVIADWSTTNNPADGGNDIWSNSNDPLMNDFDETSMFANETWAYVVPFQFEQGNVVEATDEEDQEVYFEDLTPFNENKVKFMGGDILFTQNNFETDGFEEQRLLSFSQWKGNVAMVLNLNWDWENQVISFKANKAFSFHKNMYGKVTGAALTGDNMVFTSHHDKTNLNLWNLNGDLLAQPSLYLPNGEKLEHNWGDMASKQAFDKNTFNSRSISDEGNIQNKELKGEYYEDWYRGDSPNFQYAEMKLYRPDESFNYSIADLTHDNYNVSKESRKNSANADLADYRKNASKFVSLGGNEGYVIMKLPQPMTVTEFSTLQLVETTWNRSADYFGEDGSINIDAAWSSYKETANVFIHTSYNGRYLQKEMIDAIGDDNTWKPIGQAYIANNEFNIGDDFDEGTQISWILIKDAGSKTGDAFDVNFVSVYDKINNAAVENDKRILLSLYSALGGDNWLDNSNWNTNAPLGEWYGINTNAEGRVTEIILQENKLAGELTIDLSELDQLTRFSINNREHYPHGKDSVAFNRVKGEFPSSLLQIQGIKRIELGYNYGFYGELPSEIGNLSELEILWISGNHFKGAFPREISNLKKITFLSFQVNRFSGPLVKEISEIEQLEYLRVMYNYFSSKETFEPSFTQRFSKYIIRYNYNIYYSHSYFRNYSLYRDPNPRVRF